MKKSILTLAMIVLTACQPGPLLNSGEEIPDIPASTIHFYTFKATFISSLCLRCHNATLAKGGVDLSSLEAISKKRGLLRPGDPENSLIFLVVAEGRMPPNGFLNGEQTNALQAWIEKWPGLVPAKK